MRWYVVAAVGALTVWAALALAGSSAIYWSRVEVVFLAPPTADNANNLRVPSENLIDFAALIERSINGNVEATRFSSESATLYGAGVRSGSRIELVNDGGQWTTSFRQPVLRIEAVGGSADGVRAEVSRQVEAIEDAVDTAQREAGVPSRELVTTLQSPTPTSVSEIRISRMRMFAGVGLIGVIVAGVSAIGVDRLMQRRHARSSVLA